MTALTDEKHAQFLADEGFNRDVTAGPRRHYPALDVITVQEAGLSGAPDLHVLEAARQLDRIVLSRDVHTMSTHFYALLAQIPEGEHLLGLLLVLQRTSVGNAVEWIAEVWGACRHEEWHDRVEYLPI